MEKVTVTFLSTYKINEKGEAVGDEFPEIAAIGYDGSEAFEKALEALKYACCEDFSAPKSCRPGYSALYFSAEGVAMGEDEDADDIADKLGWDDTCVFTFEGVRYAFPSNYSEWYKGGVIMSDHLRSIDSWDELFA